MGNGLKDFVHVLNPETSQYESFGPEDELPHCFADVADPGVFDTESESPGSAPTGGAGESVPALKKRIAYVTDLEALRAEQDAETRETAKKALASRIDAVTKEQLDDGSYVFGTVDELEGYVEGVDDVDQLRAFRTAEEAGPGRSTAIEALDRAIAALDG